MPCVRCPDSQSQNQTPDPTFLLGLSAASTIAINVSGLTPIFPFALESIDK